MSRGVSAFGCLAIPLDPLIYERWAMEGRGYKDGRWTGRNINVGHGGERI